MNVFSDIDECATDPCDNGGTCVDEVNAYRCNCDPGWTGLQCQTSEYNFSCSEYQWKVLS